MSAYTPPIDDLRFVLEELADLDSIRELPGYEDVQSDLVDAILSEAGKVAAQVLAPLNRVGDASMPSRACVLGWKRLSDATRVVNSRPKWRRASVRCVRSMGHVSLIVP